MKGAWKLEGLYKADATKVVNELMELGEEYSLSDVVEKARNENSEMHGIFEWNDGIAGEEYRKIQAGKMVRNIIIVRENEKKESEKSNLRYFVSTGNRDNTYTPTKCFLRKNDGYEDLLNRAYMELRAFKKKYQSISELEEILALIN